MATVKRAAKRIWFGIGIFLVFGLLAACLYWLNCYWYAYLIYVLSLSALVYIRRTKYWKGFKTLIFWAIALMFTILAISFFRPDMHGSVRAVVIREGIRAYNSLPFRQEDSSLNSGSKTSATVKSKEFKWNDTLGYTVNDYTVSGLPIEILTDEDGQKDKLILQFHGGAYISKFNDLYRGVALKYSRVSSGFSVASVDYRTAPEYTYPAALDDALKAWDWLLKQGYKPENIIIAGDSAGGNLTLALVEKLRDEGRPLPRAVICMSPWADLSSSGISYASNYYKDPIFGEKEGHLKITTYAKTYAGGTSLTNEYLSPVYADFKGFPPMLIQVGSYEILESDSQTVYKKAKDAGVDAKLTVYDGMFHLFEFLGNATPESKAAWNEIKTFINEQFD